jgi:hypothetical protein
MVHGQVPSPNTGIVQALKDAAAAWTSEGRTTVDAAAQRIAENYLDERPDWLAAQAGDKLFTNANCSNWDINYQAAHAGPCLACATRTQASRIELFIKLHIAAVPTSGLGTAVPSRALKGGFC